MLILAALTIVVALGLIHLTFPFAWDQAVFVMGGEVLARGDALYRDFWDSKQPGIFLFYATAGRLFGFHEVGIHTLELVVQLVFAVVLVVRMRESFAQPVGRALAPLLVVGYGYAITGDWHLTQIENLIGLPLFLALHGALQGAERGSSRSFVLAGVAGGIVLVTKLVLLPLVGALWMVGVVRLVMTHRERSVVRAVSALILGAALPIAFTALMLARQGSLNEAVWTTFQFPQRAMDRVTVWNSFYFIDSLKWIGKTWIPLLAFGALGARTALRRERWLAIGLLAWLGVGTGCLLLQRLSGWQYHFMLLLPPLGLLAALGVDGLIETLRSRWSSRVATALSLAVLAVLSFPAATEAARKVARLSRHQWALTREGRWGFQVETSRGNAYGRWRECSAVLSSHGALPGPIYVLGDPVMYWVTGRRPAVPRCGGTMMNQLTGTEWQQLTHDIDRTTPYIFVSRGDQRLLEILRPDSEPMLQLLRDRYRSIRDDECGTWYLHAP